MFFWNCWLRNRFRLAAYLVLGSALMLLATLPVTMKSVHGHWVWAHPKTVADAMDVWRYAVEHVALVMIFLLLFAAADLGSLGVGESTARREYDFLLTRPRPRRHFVCSAYLAGMAQLCAVALVPLAVALTTLLVLTSHIFPLQACLLTLGALTLSALAFGAAFAFTLATGSSRSGFELVFSLLIVYYAAREIRWELAMWGFLGLPTDMSPVYAHGAYDWLLTGQHVNLLSPLLMAASAAILLFVTQFGFQRKDL